MSTPFKMKGSPMERNFKIKPPTKEQSKKQKGTLRGPNEFSVAERIKNQFDGSSEKQVINMYKNALISSFNTGRKMGKKLKSYFTK